MASESRARTLALSPPDSPTAFRPNLGVALSKDQSILAPEPSPARRLDAFFSHKRSLDRESSLERKKKEQK